MSWANTLKSRYRGSRITFNNLNKAKTIARAWSFAMPHIIREKDGKFTVMSKGDDGGNIDFGPIVWEQEVRG